MKQRNKVINIRVWLEQLEEILGDHYVPKKGLLNVLDEEVLKRGMVGFTISSFHQFLDSVGQKIPDYLAVENRGSVQVSQ